jgi:hypothetical protein
MKLATFAGWSCSIFIASAVPQLSSAQQQPLARHFVAGAEERYQVTLDVKAESHSVTTETVAAQTYVTPVVSSAEVSVRWLATRRILSVMSDGSAQIEEVAIRGTARCEPQTTSGEKSEAALLASLREFCDAWLREPAARYSESIRGLLQESKESQLPALGESSPPFLALWLRRAARPDVIFPPLPFAVGATANQSFQPAANLLKGARGSESIDWLDAPGETPAAMLHVVQQLTWKSQFLQPATDSDAQLSPRDRDESFFADSLTTLSLLDGSVLRANRVASRSVIRNFDAIPGLPTPPDFSSKLTVRIVMERLP